MSSAPPTTRTPSASTTGKTCPKLSTNQKNASKTSVTKESQLNEEYGSDSTDDLPCATSVDRARSQFTVAAGTSNKIASGCEQNSSYCDEEFDAMMKMITKSLEPTKKQIDAAQASPLVATPAAPRDSKASKSVSPKISLCDSKEATSEEENEHTQPCIREPRKFSFEELKSYGWRRFERRTDTTGGLAHYYVRPCVKMNIQGIFELPNGDPAIFKEHYFRYEFQMSEWASAHGVNGTTHVGNLGEKNRPGISYAQYLKQRGVACASRNAKETAAANVVTTEKLATQETDLKASMKPVANAKERMNASTNQKVKQPSTKAGQGLQSSTGSLESKSSAQAIPAKKNSRNIAVVPKASQSNSFRLDESSAQGVPYRAVVRKGKAAPIVKKDHGTRDSKCSSQAVPVKAATKNDAVVPKVNQDVRSQRSKSSAQALLSRAADGSDNEREQRLKVPDEIDENPDLDENDKESDEENNDDDNDDDKDDGKDKDTEDGIEEYDDDDADGSTYEREVLNVPKKTAKSADGMSVVEPKDNDADERPKGARRTTAKEECRSDNDLRTGTEAKGGAGGNETNVQLLKETKETANKMKRKAEHLETSSESIRLQPNALDNKMSTASEIKGRRAQTEALTRLQTAEAASALKAALSAAPESVHKASLDNCSTTELANMKKDTPSSKLSSSSSSFSMSPSSSSSTSSSASSSSSSSPPSNSSFANSASSEPSTLTMWKELQDQSGWKWRLIRGFLGYYYIRPGAVYPECLSHVPTSVDGGKGLGYEYFESLDSAVAYAKAQQRGVSPEGDQMNKRERVDEDENNQDARRDADGDVITSDRIEQNEDKIGNKRKRDPTTSTKYPNAKPYSGDDRAISSYLSNASTSTPRIPLGQTKAIIATEAQDQRKGQLESTGTPIAAMTPPIVSRPARNEDSDSKTKKLCGQGRLSKSATTSAVEGIEKAKTARAHAQALAAEHATAKAAAEVALAKAQALEAAAKAADAAAIDAERAAAMISPNDTDNLGLPFLTLLKMVKAVVSAQAADGTPLPAAEARELKNMALRESPFLQRCFVAASDTDHGRPALGQTLPAGFNTVDFLAFVLPRI